MTFPARTEFGLTRTTCECKACATFCSHMPGFLVPADLDRLAALDTDIYAWAREHLRASPGALVMVSQTREQFRIRTLVPAATPTGACHWLVAGRCSIHAIAPYGCAFTDTHQSGSVADAVSHAGLMAVLRAWQDETLYSVVWEHLHDAGLVTTSPEERRAAMASARS